MIDQDETEAVHGWFGLTYANYLVVPRAVLQSMPDEWQRRFVGCLREMKDAYGHLDWPAYDVRTLARRAKVVTPMLTCETCDGKGVLEKDADCADCDTLGEIEDPEGSRYETAEEVGFRDDPIPHYRRGRTRIEPRGSE